MGKSELLKVGEYINYENFDVATIIEILAKPKGKEEQVRLVNQLWEKYKERHGITILDSISLLNDPLLLNLVKPDSVYVLEV